MNNVIAIVAIIIVACSAPTTTPAPSAQPARAVRSSLLAVPDCAAVATTANDTAVDSRPAIQIAATANRCAYLPAGTYYLDTPFVVPPARRPRQMGDLVGATLYGDGDATVLHFRGDANLNDWIGLRMTGAGSVVHDLRIDTSALV